MRAAVTGATGFVGAALIERLLNEDWTVAALARDPSRLLRKDAVRLIEGDLENAAALQNCAEMADVFFHLAGVTHPRRDSDYQAVNVEGAARAAAAAKAAGARFVHISSLSARRPDVSPYAASKYESERAVAGAMGRAPWLALRLPAIYGPGDVAALSYFKLVKSGVALEPRTRRPARASVLYVEDAVTAIMTAAAAPEGFVYEVGDDAPEGHSWADIGRTLGDVMGKTPTRIRAPKFIVRFYQSALQTIEKARGQARPSVRTGQANEFFHPDWVARDRLLSDFCAWRPRTSLKEGFAKTLRWYQDNGLL